MEEIWKDVIVEGFCVDKRISNYGRMNVMETILSIEEGEFHLEKGINSWTDDYDGFIIITNKQVIKLGISNDQLCCEDWGFFVCKDSNEDFIGATITGVKVVDECLDVQELVGRRGANIMFVNIETNIGTLQFTAYNEHNGYYSHEAVVVSEQLNKSVDL